MKKIRTYTELIQMPTFEERYYYLRLGDRIGNVTFGFDRYLNQQLYRSKHWRSIRDEVIIRDAACDLGIKSREIFDQIVVHHINPITMLDLKENLDYVFNPEFLITTSQNTHRAIHYGDDSFILTTTLIERQPGDTVPWRNQNGSR